MTPKEKAKELTDKLGKEHALITVDEIINCDSYFKTLEDSKVFVNYWNEVQQEITNPYRN